MRHVLRLALLVLSFVTPAASAQSIAELPDHAHALKIHSTVQPQGDAPFGERINLYTGSVSFHHEDVVVEGTGPTLRLVRETAPLPKPGHAPPAFGDWQLSVPRIETFIDATLDGQSQAPGERWVVAPPGSPDRLKRCSRIDENFAPAPLTQPWWFGVELITETGDRQQVLRRGVQNTATPTLAIPGTTGGFPIVTSAHWQVTCLDGTRNGEAGEAFLAVSPDGVRYWFDHLTSGPTIVLTENEDGTILRQRIKPAKMLVSRIEDRFGNALHYDYVGDRLVSITASDGREVRVDWRADAPLVDRIVVQPNDAKSRSWHYDYVPMTTNTAVVHQVLDSVRQADGTRWHFDLHAQSFVHGHAETRKCGVRGGLPADARTTTQTVVNPQGLVGRFEFAPTWHAHSHVLGGCVTHMPDVEPFEEKSPLYITASLVRREVSGPAVPPHAWTYAWSPAEGSVTGDACTATKTCSTTKWVDVVDPGGHRSRYVHSNVEGATDGQLLRVDRYQGHATLLQSEAFEYAAFDAGPWPDLTGSAMTPVAKRAVVRTPLVAKSIERQGVTFARRVEAFDALARPLRTKRSSSLGYARTDATTYADNTAQWVMGQVASTTNVDTDCPNPTPSMTRQPACRCASGPSASCGKR